MVLVSKHVKRFSHVAGFGSQNPFTREQRGTLIHAVVSSSKMMRKEGDSDAEQTKLRRILDFLVGEGLDINAQGPSGSPLQMASVNDSTSNLPMLRYLVEKGADVNAQGGDCRNALNAAAWSSQIDFSTIEYLVSKGADIHA
jgi:ankyrin repeat protein